MPESEYWQLVGDVVNLTEDVERVAAAVAVAADEAENGPPEIRDGAEASRAEQAAELRELRDRLDAAREAAEQIPVDVRDQIEAAYRQQLAQRGIGGVQARAGVASGGGGSNRTGDGHP